MPKEQAVEGQKGLPLTTRGKPTKFTPERLQQIINLVERGKSREEIADILGATAASLQVTCSRLGISLSRPKIDNGVGLLRKRAALGENTSHHPSDHDGRVPFQPTEEQSNGTQLQPAEPAVVAKPPQERVATPDACSADFAIRFQYWGMERTDEFPVTPHMMGQLALEAALRDVEIGELIAELITAIVNKDLFPLLLDNIDSATDRIAVSGSPPRRAKLATNPAPTGSATNTNTIGTVWVACCSSGPT